MIKPLLERLRKRTFSPALALPVALWLAIGGYVLFVNRLGFYWDEWPFAWIANTLGANGLERYFATNRPYWGMIYRLTLPLIGSEPWRWQLFGLFWHAAAAGSLWWVLRTLWPERPQAAAWAGFLFAVYPGFNQQPLGLMYGHFFIVLSALLLSLGCMLHARKQRLAGRIFFTLLGLALSFVNLMCMEYFFLLDLMRPLLLWFAVDERLWNIPVPGAKLDPEADPRPETPPRRRLDRFFGRFTKETSLAWIWQRARRVLLEWLPYLLLFAGVGVWRAFFFPYQTQNYQPQILQALKSQPLAALGELGLTILRDLWTVTGAAWGRVFMFPAPAEFGRVASMGYAALALFSAVLVVGVVLKTRPDEGRSWGWPMLALGVAALLIAGWPFWLTGLPVGLSFPNDRFTLPFILGASCFLAGLLRLIPLPQNRLGRLGSALLVALLAGLAVGQHFETANTFRRDWQRQQALFWHIRWRIPDLQPGTTLLAESWQERYNSDNSLAAPLNWIYAPDNHTSEMDYMFYFPEVRLGRGLPEMKPGLPIEQNYLAARFEGSSSQMIALNYDTDRCLRVLDPQIDPLNWQISMEMREAAVFSRPELILPAPQGEQTPALDEALFGPEPAHGWCYYFEKADLARQMGDWQQVAALGEEAFKTADHPNDPNEMLPYIEGYAHVGNWERARVISQDARRITPVMQPVLCALWQRIDDQTPDSSKKQETLQSMRREFECID